jgi:hypothetical protein
MAILEAAHHCVDEGWGDAAISELRALQQVSFYYLSTG